MATATESKLPAAQQARRDRLAAEEAANSGTAPQGTVVEGDAGVTISNTPVTPAPAAPSAPAPHEPAPNSTVSTEIKVTQEELNRLRADAERATTADGRAQVLAMELAEAQAALTAAQGASKGGGVAEVPATPGAAPAPAAVARIDATGAELTPEEREEYSEAEPIITKVVKREMAAALNGIFDGLEARIKALEGGISNVSQLSERVAKNEAQEFVDKVKKTVGNFDAVVNHEHWKAFQQAPFPGTGGTYAQALATAHHARNLDDMKYIFDTFTAKYIGAPGATNTNADSGPNYAGITPGGSAASGTVVGEKKEILKMSDRRKASEDFLKGRITQEKLDEVKKAFTKADAEGRVDYNN